MKLIVSLDCGASLTKIIYKLWKTPTEYITSYFVMDPLFEIVSAEKFENYLKYKKGVKVSNPLEQAYIQVEEEYLVFGELAKDFHAEEGLLEIKYEKAMYKVMVAIGIILEKNKIETNKNIPTEIGVLLPWNEYNARKIFTEVLQKLLKRYHFRGKIVKIKSDKNSITVRPEGSGIYSFLLREKGSKFFRDKRIGIAVFGYRNLTGFFLDNGEVEKGVASHLGVSTLVDNIMRMTSGLEREKIIKALPLAIKEASIDKYSWDKILNSEGSEIINGEKETYFLAQTSTPQWKNLTAIKNLAVTKNLSLRNAEIKEITKALDIAVNSYRERVNKWLKSTFNERLDELVFSGGGATLLLTVLEEFCQSYRRVQKGQTNNSHLMTQGPILYPYKKPILIGDRLQEHVKFNDNAIELINDRELAQRVAKVLKISKLEIEELALDTRLVDLFGIFEFLLLKQKQDEEEKLEKTILSEHKKILTASYNGMQTK